LVRQFELAHWLIVPGQNSQVAVTVFYREVCDFRVLRNPSRIGGRRGDHFLQADFSVVIVSQWVHWRKCTHRDSPISDGL